MTVAPKASVLPALTIAAPALKLTAALAQKAAEAPSAVAVEREAVKSEAAEIVAVTEAAAQIVAPVPAVTVVEIAEATVPASATSTPTSTSKN